MKEIGKNADNENLLHDGSGKYGGFVDEVNGPGAQEILGFVPTRYELRVLAEHWARTASDTTYSSFLEQGLRKGFASRRIARIGNLLGFSEAKKALDRAYDKFEKEYAGILWNPFQSGVSPEVATIRRVRSAHTWLVSKIERIDKIIHFTEVIQRIPADAEAYFGRGCVYARIGLFQRAMADYNQAIDIAPTHHHAHLQRANLRRHLGLLVEAIEDFDVLIQDDPQEPDYYVKRGLIYENLDRNEEAKRDFDRAEELGVNWEERWGWLSRRHWRTKGNSEEPEKRPWDSLG